MTRSFKIISTGAIIMTSLFLTGCLSSYSLKPDFNPQTHTLTLNDALVFDNAKQTKNSTHHQEGVIHYHQVYYLNNTQCNTIDYYHITTRDHWFLRYDKETFLRDEYNKMNSFTCDITKIADLKFFDCEYKANSRPFFYISRSELKSDESYHNEGYSNTTTISEINKQCFTTILDHFTQKAQQKNTTVSYDSIGKNP